jgi:hypothetical protein
MARGSCAHGWAAAATGSLPVSSRTYAWLPPRHQPVRRTATGRAIRGASRRPPRDRNRFLRSNDPGASVIADGIFMSYARSPRREPTRQAELAAGPVPERLLR